MHNTKILQAPTIILISLLSVIIVTASSVSYNVGANGETTVTLELEQSRVITLPLDVSDINATGASYEITNGTANIVVNDPPAILVYRSSHLTRKEQGIWYFSAGELGEGSAMVTLPQNVKVVTSSEGVSIIGGDSLILEWDNRSRIDVSYIFIGEPSVTVAPSTSQFPLLATLLLVLGVLFIVGLIRYRAKTKGKARTTDAKPNITDGQLNVMRAANVNEAKVMELLLKHNGHMKRNRLEKESGLSKSSLASSLNNLEKKNILTVDRTFHVHYVKLTPWFASLQ